MKTDSDSLYIRNKYIQRMIIVKVKCLANKDCSLFVPNEETQIEKES